MPGPFGERLNLKKASAKRDEPPAGPPPAAAKFGAKYGGGAEAKPEERRGSQVEEKKSVKIEEAPRAAPKQQDEPAVAPRVPVTPEEKRRMIPALPADDEQRRGSLTPVQEAQQSKPAKKTPSTPKSTRKQPPPQQRKPTQQAPATFSSRQVDDMKEAFEMMDLDRDGFISVEDIMGTFAAMGKTISREEAEMFLVDAPGGKMNFAVMLTMFQEKMGGTDDEQTLLENFKTLETNLGAEAGQLDERKFRQLMMSCGEPLSDEEWSAILEVAPVEAGQLDLAKFVKKIKRGDDAA